MTPYNLVNKSDNNDIMLEQFKEILRANTILTEDQISRLAARYVFLANEVEITGRTNTIS